MTEKQTPFGDPAWMLAGLGSAILAGQLMLETVMWFHRAGRPARMLLGAAPLAMAGWMLSQMGSRVDPVMPSAAPRPTRNRPLNATDAEVVEHAEARFATMPAGVIEATARSGTASDLAAIEPAGIAATADTAGATVSEAELPRARAGLAPVDPPDAEADVMPHQEGGSAPADAGAPMAENRPHALSGPRAGGPDELWRIKGVGPKLETRLRGMGYFHFDQIAAWTAAELAWVDANLEGFKGRASRDNWVEQALTLAADGDTKGFTGADDERNVLSSDPTRRVEDA